MSPTSSGSIRKILLITFVIGIGIFAFVNYRQRMQLAKVLQATNMQSDQLETGNDPENAQVAKKIVDQVRKMYSIPEDIDPTVALIVDVEKLKEKNNFYAIAKNGDYLIVTPTRALLYSPSKNIILDVVPVQLQAPADPAASTKSSTKSAASVMMTSSVSSK